VYYNEGMPVEDCDLVAIAASYPLVLKGAQMLAQRQQAMDKPLLDGLVARGFKLDIGEDASGYLMKVRRSHGGYYLNCGCSDLIVDGKIGVIQYEDVDCLVSQGLRMKNGQVIPADLLVTATGYESQLDVVRELLGDQVADKVGPIWGMDKEGELANMFKPTAQPGLWFLGSSFAQARIFSKFIALQICAREAGLVT
jgi:putative flavoprotein involved in K+ transport